MKRRQLAFILAWTIGLELIISPVLSVAAETQSKVSANDVFHTAIGVAGAILTQQNNAYRPDPNMQNDMMAFQQQQTPIPDKYFSLQKLSRVPGLMQYLALNNINPQLLNCQTLPATLHEAHNEVCRIGITADKGDPQMQLNEAFTYYNQYTQIDKMYRNFSTDSNMDGQLFGTGCMKNAMQILNGFFQYRVNELDKLATNLEALNNQFRESSRSDLDGIEEGTALLDGGNSELASKVKSKRPDLFEFGKRFNNPACKSMFPVDEFDKLGKSKGLNAINQKLKDTLTEKPPGSKFAGDSYSKAHADVVTDINSLADKVAKQMELNFSTLSESNKGYSEVLGGMKGLGANNGLAGVLSPDLFSDVQTNFTEKNDKLKAEMSDISSELGNLGGRALTMVRNLNSTAFESELNSIETKIKNDCLSRSVSLDTVLSKIYDPTASNFANKNAANFLRDKLQQIMQNDRTSLDKKLAELKAIEIQQGSRYYMKMDSSYEVQDVDAQGNLVTRVISPSVSRTPSVYLSDVIRNCEAQFKVNHLGNKMSGAAAIQRLRKLNQDYKSLAKSHAQEVKQEIRKKMVECSDKSDANNSVSGTCNSDRFNTSAPGFCANAALSCSKNMQECTKQADTYVTQIKEQRAARVRNYKALVEKNKRDIVNIFDSALGRYMRDGELLRSTFGAGFSSPSNIQREVMPESARYLGVFQSATAGSPDGALLLEDPDKYVAMFKANILLLKKSVEDQQKQIIGGAGGGKGILAQHVEDTGKKFEDVYKKAQESAKFCIDQHDGYLKDAEAQRKQMMAEQQMKQSELGEHTREFCRRYSMAQEHPGPACSGGITDLTKSISGLPGGADAANEFERVCDGYNNENGSSDELRKAYKICTAKKFEGETCQTFKKCLSPEESTSTELKTVVKAECSDETKRLYAAAVNDEAGDGYSVGISEDAYPAFCYSIDNSNRGGRPKDFLEAILQGAQQGTQASAIGQ